MSWARCPACAAIVDDAEAHAGWHALTVTESSALAGAPAPTVDEGPQWPEGLAVPVPAVMSPARLAAMRAQALPWFVPVDATLRALDGYLALPAPTPAQQAVQVRILTESVKGALTALRSLIALTLRME